MQYCSLQHRTLLLSPVTCTAGYCFSFGSMPSFFLELFLHWSPVAYWAPTNLGNSSFSILSFGLLSPWGSQGKRSEVVCHSLLQFLQWTTFCQTSPPWPNRLGWSHSAWLSFTELDKAVVLWSDWLVVCDCDFSLSALWCPLATPTILLGFLLPWTRGISHGRPSWPWTWSSSSWPSCVAASPWRWDCYYWPSPLISGVGKLLSAAAPARSIVDSSLLCPLS